MGGGASGRRASALRGGKEAEEGEEGRVRRMRRRCVGAHWGSVTYVVQGGTQLAGMFTSKYSRGVGEIDMSEVRGEELHERRVCPVRVP